MIHNVLEAACKAIKIEPSTYEESGKPILDDDTYEELLAWIVREALEKLPKSQKAEVTRIFALFAKAEITKLSKEENKELDCDEDATGLSDPEIIVSGLKMYAVKGSRRAACAAARLLGPTFLDRLDLELGRLDAITLLTRQKLRPKSPITASLWQARTGAKITHRIVRLADDSYGLIAKTKGKWTWEEGPRDDILATVPDVLMESAIDTIVGVGKLKTDEKSGKKKTSSALEVHTPDYGVAAAAIGEKGKVFVASSNGRFAVLGSRAPALTFGKDPQGAVRGMHANGNAAVTWGASVILWRDERPSVVVDEKVDGAIVRDDGTVVWWKDDTIQFPKKKRVGFSKQTVSSTNGRLVAVSAKGAKVFDVKTGELVRELPLMGSGHALSPDAARIATWSSGPKSRVVEIADLAAAKSLATLKLDSGEIDHVVFTDDDQIFVRYHKQKRVAVFDPHGKQKHRLAARDVSSPGSLIEELFPLQRGAILGFAPYPRGELFVFAPNAKVLRSEKLGNFYLGGKTAFADTSARTVFAHHHDDMMRLVVLS